MLLLPTGMYRTRIRHEVQSRTMEYFKSKGEFCSMDEMTFGKVSTLSSKKKEKGERQIKIASQLAG